MQELLEPYVQIQAGFSFFFVSQIFPQETSGERHKGSFGRRAVGESISAVLRFSVVLALSPGPGQEGRLKAGSEFAKPLHGKPFCRGKTTRGRDPQIKWAQREDQSW